MSPLRTREPAPARECKHANIPIFIPHLGCPNNCVFCNQRTISGHGDFELASVRGEIERAIATLGERESEIAFFGGSFTGIDRRLMVELLELATEYVRAGRVRSIRLSTRPDYVDEEILELLRCYPVTDIELGLQSLSDRVLALSRRGHTSEAAISACRRVKSYGFNLVGQIMIALPGSTLEDELMTARRVAELCDFARIYPTVVFRGTELASMYQRGEYVPPELMETVARSAAALEVFESAAVPVLRIGLCASDSLSDPTEAIAGAVHPALGELVVGERYFARISALLPDAAAAAVVYVNPREVSKAIGHNRRNLARLPGIRIVEDATVTSGEIRISLQD